jgi:hypothetical protein
MTRMDSILNRKMRARARVRARKATRLRSLRKARMRSRKRKGMPQCRKLRRRVFYCVFGDAFHRADCLQDALRHRANKFLGVAKDTTRSQEDVLSTPLPGEKIRQFYERSKEYWAGTAYERTGSRGKTLRREGFRAFSSSLATHCRSVDLTAELAMTKYGEYKPVLEEIERIQKEAELDATQAAASKRTGGTGPGEGRNRR